MNRDMRVGVVLALDPRLLKSGAAEAQQVFNATFDSMVASAGSASNAVKRLADTQALVNTAQRTGLKVTEEQKQALEALRRVTESQGKAFEQAAKAQQAWNEQLNVKSDFGIQQRAADIQAYGSALDDVRAKFNPLFAAQQSYKRQLEEIAAAKRVGAINAREEVEAIQRTKNAFAAQVVQINRARDAATQHGGAVKLQAYQMANLLQQFQDIAVQAGSGTSPFVILLQQGPQITSAMGGMRNAFGLVMQTLTPMRIGLGLAAAGMAVVTARAADIAGESRAAGVSIRAFGKEAEITSGQIHDLVERMRDLGVAKDDARDAIDASLRVPRATGADVARAAGLAPDFAAGFKTSIADAQVQLTELGTKGYAAIKKLDEAYNFLSADQARVIRELADQGRQAEATEIAFAALETRIKGLAKDAMTPAGRLLNEFGRAWTRTVDLLANSGPVIATLSALGQGLNKVSDWLERSGKQPASSGSDLAQINADITSLQRSRNPKLVQPQLDALEARRQALLSNRLQSSEDDRIAANRALAGSGAASQPRADQQATKYVDEQTKAYQRQEEVLRSSAGSRELVRARLEAESEARERNIEGSAREELIALRVREAKLRLATAANDNLVALQAEAAGSLAVAEAYRLSETAGRAAEAGLQARMAALQNNTVDEKSLATAIRERAAAQSLVETTKSARNLAYEAADQEKLVMASRQGAEASREAARQIEVEAFRRQALAAATDKTREAVLAEIEVYDQASRRRLEAQRQIERETVLRKAAQDASIAAAEAQAAAISDPALRRQAELAIARQQKINELTEQYGTVADGTGRKLLEMWDAAQQSREQARFFDDVRNKAQELAGDIKGFMLDGLTGVYNNGKSIFENMWDAALKGAKRFALNVALTFAEQAIVMPVVMQLVSSAPGLFGVTAPQTAPGSAISGGPGIISGFGGGTFSPGGLPGAGGGGGLGLGSFNPFSALSSASNFFPSFGSAINSFGASAFGLASGATISTASANALGISAGQAALLNNAGATGALGSTTLSGLLGGVGLGFGAGSLLNSLVGGNQVGGMIGSGVGALGGAIIGSIVPGIGTLLGGLIGGSGGGLLGGLFGPGKSVGPIGHTNINAVNGRLVIGSTGVDNGADPNATISQAQQLVQAANALADKYSLVISSGTTIGQGKADGPGSAAAALQALINNGAFTSSDAVVQQILNASRGKSAEQFEENLQFADVYKAFSELQKPANAAADAIRETAKAYQEAKTKAQELGLSVSALQQGAAANVNQDMARQIKAILDPQALALEDFADVAEERLKYVQEVGADMAKAEQLNMLQRQQILQQGLQGMTGTLRQWLDNQLLGATSNLTGIEKLSEAQTQFESAKSAGNTNRVVELADYIANLATELYGGTLQGAQLVDWTRSQVKEYGKSLGLPGFAVGTSSAPAGWAWVGENGPELMRFRGGEQVLPHRLSVAVANNNMPGESREDFIQLAMLLASINADTSVLRRDLPVNNDLLRNLVDRLDRYLTAADQMKRVA